MTSDPGSKVASPAVGSPPRKRSLRGGGPLSGDDFRELAGFADASASAPGTMRPGALRGSAQGRDLDSLAHTLFLRIYPVIALVVLATQIGIAWVNYTDSLRLYTERANLLVTLTAHSIARPDWSERPDVYTAQIQALTLDPAFQFVRAWNAAGGLVMSVGEIPAGRGLELIRASSTVTVAGRAESAGRLTLGLSTEALRRNAEKQALLALGATLILMLAFVLTLHANVRKHVLAPLKRLLLAMREVEHKRWSLVEFDGAVRASNEIDVISSAFNRMVEGLRAGDEAKQLLAELEQAHAKLADANNQVMESIGYARRIQTSVLPDRAALAGAGIDVAVLWEPLHQVGGDYFWLERLDDLSIVVVADCTGHGVPGAFITLIVATALDRLLHERGLRSPAEILTALDEMVRVQLRQDGRGAESDDGLDCGVCIWDPRGTKAELRRRRTGAHQHHGSGPHPDQGRAARARLPTAREHPVHDRGHHSGRGAGRHLLPDDRRPHRPDGPPRRATPAPRASWRVGYSPSQPRRETRPADQHSRGRARCLSGARKPPGRHDPGRVPADTSHLA